MSVSIVLPSDFSPEERRSRAMGLFRQGYNCCQAVVLSFKDILETNNLASEEVLKVIGSGFGGGMARMREVCGSFSGAVMMAGFISPASDPEVKSDRTANYALVQNMAEEFRQLNGGSIVCRELLGLSPLQKEGPVPSDRTPEFYKKRPCEQIIGNSAFIVAERLLQFK
jgi:C_GCAxxG_C_C family probable redox protein